jgi:hypothetical protein
MNPKRANQGNPCPRNIRKLWLGLMTVISTVLTQASTQAQGVVSADRISIDYGMVTQHYQTTWSDPTLPAGVARGMPPSVTASAMDSGSDNEGESNRPVDTTSDANSAETETDDFTREAAVLYAIDLDSGGMTMVVSAKTTLQPGDCAAIERSGTYLNLRGVNAGFCNPTNLGIIASLQSVNEALAQRCRVAREQLLVLTVEENQNLTPSEIGMLCDGS